MNARPASSPVRRPGCLGSEAPWACSPRGQGSAQGAREGQNAQGGAARTSLPPASRQLAVARLEEMNEVLEAFGRDSFGLL
jgi:hypothetical protein